MADFYVAKTGSDSDPGTIGEPFLTVMHGISALSAGDTLYIRTGTYTEGLRSIPSGVSQAAPTTITAYSGETVTINGVYSTLLVYIIDRHHITFDDLIFDGINTTGSGISVGGTSDHIVVQNSEVKNVAHSGILFKSYVTYSTIFNVSIHDNGDSVLHHGIYVKGDYNTVDNCEIYNNAGHGIHNWNNTTWTCDCNLYENNNVHNNGLVTGPGIGIYVGVDNIVRNNNVHDEGRGIRVSYNARGTLVETNTLTQCSTYGIGVENGGGTGYGPAVNTTLKCNTFVSCSTDIVDTGTGTSYEECDAVSVIDIDHEGNNLNEYDNTATDGGDLSTSAAAALAGSNYGLSCVINDTTGMYGEALFSPPASNIIRARFYIDPNGLTMAEDNAFGVFRLVSSTGSNRVLFVQFRYVSSAYRVRVYHIDDASSWSTVGDEAVSDAAHYIEVEVVGSSSAGTAEFWIDGVSAGSLSSLNNDTQFSQIAGCRLGPSVDLDAGTSGTFYLDELIVNDTGDEIGPLAHELTATNLVIGAPVLGTPTLGTEKSNRRRRQRINWFLTG